MTDNVSDVTYIRKILNLLHVVFVEYYMEASKPKWVNPILKKHWG